MSTGSDAVIGIDVGTTSVKVLALSSKGVVAQAAVAHPILSPNPGWIEEEPAAWWRGVASAASAVIHKLSGQRIAAVGVTSMTPAMVLVDGQGQSLRPAILQSDSRAARELASMALDPPDVLSRTGSPLNLQQVGPRFKWVAKHEPWVVEKLAMIMGGADYITWRLTGSCQVEQNWAMESGLWDFQLREWVDTYLLAAGIRRELLPRVAPAMEVVGWVSGQGALCTGLPKDTPVIAGSADHIAAALGTGLKADGDLLIKIGAAGDILAVTQEARPDRRLFLDFHDIPGLFVANGCMVTSGVLLHWLSNLCDSAGSRSDLQARDDLARRLGPTAGGLIVLPYFSGEKTPIFDPHARGLIFGLTLAHGMPHVHRALMEGVAYATRHHLDVLQELGVPIRRILLADGGAKSTLWQQIFADVLGREVTAYPGHSGSALGVAFLAGMAVGMFKNWSDVECFVGNGVHAEPGKDSATYQQAYDVYRELYEDVKGLMATVSQRSGTWEAESRV